MSLFKSMHRGSSSFEQEIALLPESSDSHIVEIEQSYNQSYNQSINQSNEPDSKSVDQPFNPLYGDVLRLCLSYIPGSQYWTGQVSRSWRVISESVAARYGQLEQLKPDYKGRYHGMMHFLEFSPERYDIVKCELKAIKLASSSHRPAMELHLIEIEYDESLKAAYDRVRRGFPAFMTMHDAMQLVIDEGPWPHVQALTLETLDDHRTIFPHRLDALLKTMPNLLGLIFRTRKAYRPFVRNLKQLKHFGPGRYVSQTEFAYQELLLTYLIEKCQAQLALLQLPVWTSWSKLSAIMQLFHSQFLCSRWFKFGPLREHLCELTIEHRLDYDNCRLPRYASLLYSSLNFYSLNSIELRAMYTWELEEGIRRATQHLQAFKAIDLRYHRCLDHTQSPPETVLQPLQALDMISIIADSTMLPMTHCDPQVIQRLGCVELDDLIDDSSAFIQLKHLEITCRAQPELECGEIVRAPIVGSSQTLSTNLISFVSFSFTITLLYIHHLPFCWCTQLLTVPLPHLTKLVLQFDDTMLDLSLNSSQPVNQTSNVSERSTIFAPDSAIIWPKLKRLFLGASQLSVHMLELALRCPKLKSLTLEEHRQQDSLYRWERESFDDAAHALNRQWQLTDDHLVLLSQCPKLVDLSVQSCNQLTVRSLIALSFVTSLQHAKFSTCKGLHYRDLQVLLDQSVFQSNQSYDPPVSFSVGCDSRRLGVSNLECITFEQCPAMLTELPLQVGSRVRASMTRWSEHRLRNAYELTDQNNKGIHQASSNNDDMHHVLELGSTRINVSSSAVLGRVIEFTTANVCKCLSDPADSDSCYLPPIISHMTRYGSLTYGQRLCHWRLFMAESVDRFNLSFTTFHQAAFTSHVEWASTAMHFTDSPTLELFVPLLYKTALPILCGVFVTGLVRYARPEELDVSLFRTLVYVNVFFFQFIWFYKRESRLMWIHVNDYVPWSLTRPYIYLSFLGYVHLYLFLLYFCTVSIANPNWREDGWGLPYGYYRYRQ